MAIKKEIGAAEGTRSARNGEASSLNNLGGAYSDLGQYPKGVGNVKPMEMGPLLYLVKAWLSKFCLGSRNPPL
jgi:hypothetical protein